MSYWSTCMLAMRVFLSGLVRRGKCWTDGPTRTVPPGVDLDNLTKAEAKNLVALWKAEAIPAEICRFELEAFYARWGLQSLEKKPTKKN